MANDLVDDDRRHVRDLVAAYVLGAVTPLERELVESHLATCDSCQGLAAELRGVEAVLPTLAGEREPPVALKTRLMGMVEAEAWAARTPYPLYAPDAPPVVGSPDVLDALDALHEGVQARLPIDTDIQPPDMWPLRRGRGRGRGRGRSVDASARTAGPRPWRRPSQSVGRGVALLAMAAAVALVALGVGLWRLTGSAPPRPSTEVAIAGQPSQPAIGGLLRYYKDGGRIDLDLHGLRPIASNQVYELWLIRGRYRLAKGLGTFRPARDGTARLTTGSDDVSHYMLACLTVERAPGALRPTLPLVAAGDIG